MKNIKKLTINEDATIKEALKAISKGKIKITIVVDAKGKLIGTLSDGDIRRGFLKRLNIDSPVKSLINRKPLIEKKGDNRAKILKNAISRKINEIPVVDKKGKVIEIIFIDKIKTKEAKFNKIVIMAGGKGTRLKSLTKNIPKPMLKVSGQPILQKIIERFSDCGFKDFIICINYKANIIKNYFGNGNRFGVTIEYIKEKKRMGTAGALSLLKGKLKETFFVINGDLVTNLDFGRMFDFHNSHGAVATMGVKEYSLNSPYGEVRLVNENIHSINEKPTHKFFANAGIYILNPECVNLVPNKFFDMTTLFKKIILKKKKTISFPLDEYWKDIGTPIDYQEVNKQHYKKY